MRGLPIKFVLCRRDGAMGGNPKCWCESGVRSPFQGLGVGGLETQGVALGWYGNAPLGLWRGIQAHEFSRVRLGVGP